MKISEALRKARGKVATSWMQGELYDDFNGEVCALGAIRWAVLYEKWSQDDRNEDFSIYAQRERHIGETVEVEQFYAQFVPDYRPKNVPVEDEFAAPSRIVHFNDRDLTQKTDVLDTFDHAIKVAEEDELLTEPTLPSI